MGRAAASQASRDALGDALDGRLGQGAVRRIVRDPMRFGLRNVTGRNLPGDGTWRLTLLRTKYKPSRKLTAYYHLSSGGLGGQGSHLAVSWHAHPQAQLRITAHAAGRREPPALFEQASAQPDGAWMTMLESPADPAMPQLGRLTDHGHLADLVDRLTGRSAKSTEPASISTIRYRPGQRHVLAARLGLTAIYVKADRDDSGARAVPVAEFLGRVLARRCQDALVAEPVGYSGDDSAALWWAASGQPLSRVISRPTSGQARAVERAGRVLRALHDCPSTEGVDPALELIGWHDAPTEAASTLRAGEHIAALLAPVGRTYEAAVGEVMDGLDRLPKEPATFCHGDFKTDNLLVHKGALRILDLDRACWADPAVDLGKFLADLRWWCPLGDEAGTLFAAFRAGYGHCDPTRWARAELFAALFALKHAARRLPVHDADWEVRTRAQVTVATAAVRATRRA